MADGSRAEIRPLLIAEAANPEWVSVPLTGWSMARALQQKVGGHIVTQIRNREAFLRAGLVEGEDFTAIDSERIAAPMYRLSSALRMGSGKGWTTVTAVSFFSYLYFERLVWARFRDDLRARRYTVVHRITPKTPTTPSPLAGRLAAEGIPFVMGPMNGGLPWPPGFDSERVKEREWLSFVRGAYNYMPYAAATKRHAAAVIAGSRSTEAEYAGTVSDRLIYIAANGIEPERFTLPPREGLNTPLRACFIGRMVPYKGPDMLLRAAAPLIRAGDLTLDMIGDGPFLAELKELAEAEGIAAGVTFHGNIPHVDLQHTVRACDLFTFPSIREFGGAVVLEAMMLGVVPVIVGYGGPDELVSDDTGFRIPIGTREEIVARLREQLARLVADPSCLPAMGAAARARVQTLFTWERKAEQIAEVYRWALGQSPTRPDPFANG